MPGLGVAEQFYTIQGEGPSAGTPAVFLRMAGCNLQCGAVGRDLDDVNPQEDNPTDGATWVCDTIDVWKDPEFIVEPDELLETWEENGWIEKIDNGAHIVLTGGEPTLPTHQDSFVELYDELLRREVRPYVEVETNGTIKPESQFNACIDQYNVSMKLSNSGHSKDERVKDDAVTFHRDSEFSTFKFVVSSQDDINEIKSLQKEYDIPNGDVSVMPAGQTREQLKDTYPRVAELCKEEGWRFSPRLHVNIWNLQTGV
jgi:6-pyruvoyltetrahydropterin 2'-reductase